METSCRDELKKQKNTLLVRKANFYFRAEKPSPNSTEANQNYSTIEGYRLKTRATFSTRAPVGRIQWVIDHLFEVYHLIKQIGLSNTLKFLKYASQPKVIYVDCVKVQSGSQSKPQYFRSPFGIPLSTSYSEQDLQQYSCSECDIEEDKIARTFNIDKALKNIQPLSTSLKQNSNETSTSDQINPANWVVAGAGNFCASMLAPSIINTGGKIKGVCSNVGASAEILASIFNINAVYGSFQDMMHSPKIANNLLIATPPHLHPQHLVEALQSGYKIYSEKPVSVDQQGLKLLKPHQDYENCMIGFNRRFAPAVEYIVNSNAYKNNKQPKMITYIALLGEFSIAMATKKIGGGTTVGSCCHYLDLIEYLAQSTVTSFKVDSIQDSNSGLTDGYSFSCVLKMENGSLATLIFTRSKKHPADTRERIIISSDGFNAAINDFKEATVNNHKKRFFKCPKGWHNAMQHFHQTTPLSASPKTPTLAQGIHITELTLAIDKAIEDQLRNQS